MRQIYRRRRFFDAKRAGQFAFTLFVVFIAYKILTPPSDIAAVSKAPDGGMTARVRRVFYYDNQPSYRVDYRGRGERFWKHLYLLPAYTNAPPGRVEPDIVWASDSSRLDLLMNGTSVWHHVFN